MKESSSEMRTAVAALFLGAGKDRLSEEEAINQMCIKRRWWDPETGKKFIERAVSLGLIKKEGSALYPGFDHESEDVPLGYAPEDIQLDEVMETSFDVSGLDYPFTDEVKAIMAGLREGKIEKEELEQMLDMAEKRILKG